MKNKSKKTKTSTKIAQTAAGLAITAGVVAAGATLVNPDNRRKVKTLAKEGADQIKKISEEVKNSANQIYASSIEPETKKSK